MVKSIPGHSQLTRIIRCNQDQEQHHARLKTLWKTPKTLGRASETVGKTPRTVGKTPKTPGKTRFSERKTEISEGKNELPLRKSKISQRKTQFLDGEGANHLQFVSTFMALFLRLFARKLSVKRRQTDSEQQGGLFFIAFALLHDFVEIGLLLFPQKILQRNCL